MNEPTRWDPSLVKKFSSSNHNKLLNQLRNEVKKYPLNNKKNSSPIQSNDSNIDNKNKSNVLVTQNRTFAINSNHSNEINSNKSTVSFNNAKNFSIYNQTSTNNIYRQDNNYLPEQTKSNDESSSPTFKERLNQIDMK